MEGKHVYQAIAEVAAHIAKEGISKDRKNQQQGFAFRGIDDIYNALAPAMVKAQLVIIPKVTSRSLREVTTAKGTVLYYVVIEAEYDFVSAKDGSQHTAKVIGEAMDSGDKATNKAMSAAYKYLCIQTFCIPTEGDNDADATTHQPIATRKTTVAPVMVDDYPKDTDRKHLFSLLEQTNFNDNIKEQYKTRIVNCKTWDSFNNLKDGFEANKKHISQIPNPSAKDTNSHLKTVQS